MYSILYPGGRLRRRRRWATMGIGPTVYPCIYPFIHISMFLCYYVFIYLSFQARGWDGERPGKTMYLFYIHLCIYLSMYISTQARDWDGAERPGPGAEGEPRAEGEGRRQGEVNRQGHAGLRLQVRILCISIYICIYLHIYLSIKRKVNWQGHARLKVRRPSLYRFQMIT